MRKIIPIILWSAVIATFLTLLFMRWRQTNGFQFVMVHPGDPPGRLLEEVPWKHFPDVPPFQMVDQSGSRFDSRSLAGKPYLVSFFFARCPVICRQLNTQIAALNEQLRNEDIAFISITVDSKNDTPEVLQRYSQDFGASPGRWFFLTDQHYKIVQLGEHVFNVLVGDNPDDHTHTEDLLLVDKWGRFRDRFHWNDPVDLRRLQKVIREVAAESEPPLEQSFRTRNVIADASSPATAQTQWIRDFHLTDSNRQPFFSRDLTGQVWITSFFYSSCPGICVQQNAYLTQLRETRGKDLPILVSITTDAANDTPEKLAQYAATLNADERWKFCTGDAHLIERIGSEFFTAMSGDGQHSSKLYVVDRWHQLRGSFDWQQPAEEAAMFELIEKLKVEDKPVYEQKLKSEFIEATE